MTVNEMTKWLAYEIMKWLVDEIMEWLDEMPVYEMPVDEITVVAAM